MNLDKLRHAISRFPITVVEVSPKTVEILFRETHGTYYVIENHESVNGVAERLVKAYLKWDRQHGD